jgi:hypothetical protein
MTPPTAVNIERYMREREACHLYVEEESTAPEAVDTTANVARYVREREACHLYVLDDGPPAR